MHSARHWALDLGQGGTKASSHGTETRRWVATERLKYTWKNQLTLRLCCLYSPLIFRAHAGRYRAFSSALKNERSHNFLYQKTVAPQFSSPLKSISRSADVSERKLITARRWQRGKLGECLNKEWNSRDENSKEPGDFFYTPGSAGAAEHITRLTWHDGGKNRRGLQVKCQQCWG